MYFMDFTYIFVLIGALICLAASSGMKSTYRRYAQVASSRGMTGAEVARRILAANSIYDVQVQMVGGELTDHYDPRTKTVNLSQSIYASTSIAAIGVAAHECGHAIQHATEYTPLSLRSAFVPIANIGSQAAWPLIILGVLLGNAGYYLIQIGIIAFSMAVIFQFVTLPVEFNASHRALVQLEQLDILSGDEQSGARKVLKAAAMTYVAATASAILQLLRLWILFGGRRSRD